ncbi:hypothetical protein ABGB12_11645 [Actinocorallia sp. B10E7]|uniref:hypothetical protein n=1 Tax=Actinocorallia sp. B10E7 TaxID=3153558 RepID=UPI00325F791B
MSRTKTLALATATAAAAALAIASPASAWTGGAITANLSSPLTVNSSIGTATCTSSTLNGSVTADEVLTVSSASIGGCTGTFSISVTPTNLPWGGTLGANSVSITGFQVSANVGVFGGITCIYGGSLNGSVTGSAPTLQASFSNVTVNKVSSGSHWFCPGSATISGGYTITGPGL